MIRSIIHSIIMSILSTLVLVSCQVGTTKKVRISVTTTDPKVREIKLNISAMVSPETTSLSEAKIDPSGNAVFEFDLPHPVFASMELGKQWVALYLEPGYDLKINLDTIPEKEIVFSGKGTDPNYYLSRSHVIYKPYEHRGGKYLWELTPSQFVVRLDSLKNDFATFHLRFCDSTHLSESISGILEMNNRLNLISFRQNYLLAHRQDITSSGHLPVLLTNISKDIPFEDDLLNYHIDNYGMVLSWYLELDIENPLSEKYKGTKDFKELIPRLINDSLEKYSEYPAVVKEFLLARNIYCQMDYNREGTVIDSLFDNFKKSYPSSDYLSQLKIRSDKRRDLLPGKAAPDLTGTTLDDKPFSIKELKGKIVYIDVWATWCGPCRAEFPASKKLRKKFDQDKNVVFLYLSIDRDVKAWKKLVTTDKDLKGIHINQQDDNVLKSYLIKGPCYLLIDQEGKIVNSNAPKPSSGKVEIEINKLLKR